MHQLSTALTFIEDLAPGQGDDPDGYDSGSSNDMMDDTIDAKDFIDDCSEYSDFCMLTLAEKEVAGSVTIQRSNARKRVEVAILEDEWQVGSDILNAHIQPSTLKDYASSLLDEEYGDLVEAVHDIRKVVYECGASSLTLKREGRISRLPVYAVTMKKVDLSTFVIHFVRFVVYL